MTLDTHGYPRGKWPRPDTLRERFWRYVGGWTLNPDDCWTWIGSVASSGYGQIQTGRHTPAGNPSPELAHRVAYRLLVGAIPDGLHLDHLCRNRLCVNPRHLEPVTNAENARRGSTLTHCKNGHELAGTAYIYPPTPGRNKRECHLCKLERTRQWRAARARQDH